MAASDLTNLPIKFTPSKFLSVRYLIPLAVLLLVAVVVLKNKNWVIVASVNGQPITRWQMDSRLVSMYGAQTLDQMVNEMLLRQAAAKKGITVSQADIDSKIADVEKSLAGKISLRDALARQGLSMQEFRQQVELQLLFEKITADQVQVSDQEIADYITKNRNTLTATDDAGLKEEAKTTLQSQKKNEVFNKYFSDLRNSAKINKYL